MACVLQGEEMTDEPFKQHLTPLEVCGAVQNALSALWLSTPADERSPDTLERAALHVFAGVEKWWLGLKDRAGHAIVSAEQQAFAIPASAREALEAGTERIATFVAVLSSRSFAEALFWAWLLQSERTRTPEGTAEAVRQILGRQLRAAAEDVVMFTDEGEGAR